MSKSGICARKNCVIRVRTDSPDIVIPETIDIGQFNSANVETLFNQYQAGIVVLPGDDDPITKLVREYGSDSFYESVAAINLYFAREDVRNLINTDYPLVQQRINAEILFTPIEMAEFILDYGYTPLALKSQTTIISNKLIFELEAFYTGNFTSSSMGGFCALLPSVFGAIGTFFSALNDAKNLINKLKNFSLDFSLASLIAGLKKKILDVVDKVVDKVKGIVENFSIDNVISSITSAVNEKIAGQFHQIKETAMKFFDKLNIENFKAKIEALIDYATGLFKEPKLEDIQFLLFRFCGFITLVEEGINSLKNPLDDYANSYKQAVTSIQSNSISNTVRSVTAGAIRYTPDVIQTNSQASSQIYEAAGNAPPLTPEDYKNIVQWNDSKGEPGRLTFNGNWVRKLGRDGWERVDPRARAMLMRVQKDFGKPLFLNSGYRSPAYNASVGGAKNSYHKQGMACDCSWGGMTVEDRERFIRIARSHGFRGIGRYGTRFVHIDIGPERTWNG